MSVRRLSKSYISGGGDAGPKSSSFLASYSPAIDEMDLIQRVTVGSGGAASIEFTLIPGTYQHLQIRILAKSTVSPVSSIYARFNGTGNGSTAYAQHYLYGDGAAAAAGAASSSDIMLVGTCTGAFTNVFGASVVDILDYASTSKNKVIRSLSGADVNGAGGYVQIFSGLYASTSAVSSILLYNGLNSWSQYTTAALYGVKA